MKKHYLFLLFTVLLVLGPKKNWAQNWLLAGNFQINPAYSILGTRDASPMNIATSNHTRIFIHANGNIGVGEMYEPQAPLHFTNGDINKNRRIVLYTVQSNDHQFYGLGVNSNTLRYQVDATTASHVFYAARNAINSAELFRIQGDGAIKIPSSGTLDLAGDLSTANREANAGTIAYKRWDNALDIVGASTGTDQWTRRITMFAEGGTKFVGNVITSASVGIGTNSPNAALQFANTMNNRRMVLWEEANNDHQFYGLGINDNALRYQISKPEASHVFYVGTGTGSSKELFRIKGTGALSVPSAVVLEFGYDDVKKIAGSGTISYINNSLTIVGAGTSNANTTLELAAANTNIFGGRLYVNTTAAKAAIPAKLADGSDMSGYALFVNGGIMAKECRIRTSWADYVFKKDYNLSPLEAVEKTINDSGHLPGMPSAKEVDQNGISVGEMVRLQQEKIEELTLYLIKMKKEIEELKARTGSASISK